ncbi:MAG: alpha/beta hydrolase, partial [Flavisolibacter sp.]|nr:alpha/beta hydrolase [Flavisolibacter sp.]
NIIIYGKSIGTGVATQLASVKPCKQLILETPYYDINTLIRHYLPIYPTGMMIKYKFLTYLNLKNVHAPVTILHGTDDEVIPYQQAKRLQELYPQIELVTIKGGKHNNLLLYPQFQKKLDSLLHH